MRDPFEGVARLPATLPHPTVRQSSGPVRFEPVSPSPARNCSHPLLLCQRQMAKPVNRLFLGRLQTSATSNSCPDSPVLTGLPGAWLTAGTVFHQAVPAVSHKEAADRRAPEALLEARGWTLEEGPSEPDRLCPSGRYTTEGPDRTTMTNVAEPAGVDAKCMDNCFGSALCWPW